MLNRKESKMLSMQRKSARLASIVSSASSSLSDFSGWRSAGLYPLAGGGRGIWRGAFGGARRRDRRGPRISF